MSSSYAVVPAARGLLFEGHQPAEDGRDVSAGDGVPSSTSAPSSYPSLPDPLPAPRGRRAPSCAGGRPPAESRRRSPRPPWRSSPGAPRARCRRSSRCRPARADGRPPPVRATLRRRAARRSRCRRRRRGRCPGEPGQRCSASRRPPQRCSPRAPCVGRRGSRASTALNCDHCASVTAVSVSGEWKWVNAPSQPGADAQQLARPRRAWDRPAGTRSEPSRCRSRDETDARSARSTPGDSRGRRRTDGRRARGSPRSKVGSSGVKRTIGRAIPAPRSSAASSTVATP